MKILMIGDIVGRPGRMAMARIATRYKAEGRGRGDSCRRSQHRLNHPAHRRLGLRVAQCTGLVEGLLSQRQPELLGHDQHAEIHLQELAGEQQAAQAAQRSG